jgi:hypothetical protein
MASAFAGNPCADEAEAGELSAEIKRLYDEGEAEREDRSSQATSVLERDEARLKAARKMDKKGQLCTAEDKWYAAWIMTQADKVPILERAYELAQETMNEHYVNGPWLVAFTFDLKRVAEGYNQSYGTQTQINERGERCLVELEPDVTDEERAAYGVKPIAETYRSVLDLNGFRDDEATLERLRRRGLYCRPQPIDPKAAKRIAPPPAEEGAEPVNSGPERLDPVE